MTGLDIKTVKKYSQMSYDEYQEYFFNYRQRVKCFDAFEQEVIEICRTANSSKLNSSAVYDLLEERHGELPATERSFRNYMAYLRMSRKLTHKEERIYEPVPQLPMGKQMQVDFGQYQMRNGQKFYIFAAVLSASRCRYVKLFNQPMRTHDLIHSLNDCFAYYGGITAEIVIDQDRLMVVDENKGDIVLTKDFATYREEMGFDLYVCRKADPESKGKVENLVNFVKRSFLSTRTFASMAEAESRLAKWLVRKANGKKSAATGRKPMEHLEEERKHLQPLRNSIFTLSDKNFREFRRVDKLNQISVRGAKLMIPSEFRVKTVSIFISAEEVHIFDPDTDKKLAVYTLRTGLSKAPIVRQKSLKENGYKALKNKLSSRFHFKEWNLFVETNYQTYQRYFSDQYNDFLRKIPKMTDSDVFVEAVNYCVSNKTVSISQLYDTYRYLLEKTRPIKEASINEYKLLANRNYQSPLVAKREISSYTSLLRPAGNQEVSR